MRRVRIRAFLSFGFCSFTSIVFSEPNAAGLLPSPAAVRVSRTRIWPQSNASPVVRCTGTLHGLAFDLFNRRAMTDKIQLSFASLDATISVSTRPSDDNRGRDTEPRVLRSGGGAYSTRVLRVVLYIHARFGRRTNGACASLCAYRKRVKRNVQHDECADRGRRPVREIIESHDLAALQSFGAWHWFSTAWRFPAAAERDWK